MYKTIKNSTQQKQIISRKKVREKILKWEKKQHGNQTNYKTTHNQHK
jgi:hypothetical protein